MILTTSPRDILARNSRATSPPLEKDEREFTQTARGMQMQRRKLSQDFGRKSATVTNAPETYDVPGDDSATKNIEFAESLFGRAHALSHAMNSVEIASPVVKASAPLPITGMSLGKRGFEEMSWEKIEQGMDWDMRSPEQVELEELDGLLDDF
jgi:hypothetical protein